jgi:hypothetical protein
MHKALSNKGFFFLSAILKIAANTNALPAGAATDENSHWPTLKSGNAPHSMYESSAHAVYEFSGCRIR